MAAVVGVLSSLLLVSNATQALAQPAHAARPVVVSFLASPKSVPARGGKVHLTGVVKHGRTCTVRSTPRLAGLPWSTHCGGGRVERTVRVPAVQSGRSISYRFTLAVTGAGGKATSKPLTVVAGTASPSISGFAASPSDLPAAGGPAVLAATVQRSTSCTISASPAITGLPDTVSCAAGSVPRAVELPVSMPALTGAAAQKYSFTLKVTGPGGTASALASATMWPAMQFSSPLPVDSPGGRLGPISCVSATFCMGVDVAGGYALRWNGTSWSAPVRFETGPYPDAGYLISLSCATTTFCMAADASGNSFTYNGSSWSATPGVGLSVTSLSCASATFCVAVSASEASVYAGASWSTPVVVSGQDPLVSVSCPAVSSCVAVSTGGNAFTYTGAGWGTAVPFDTASADVNGLACASAALCVAIDQNGYAVVDTGTWATPVKLSSDPMDSVSCAPASSFCMAFSEGSYYTFDGTSWSSAQTLAGSNPTEVSCASSTACMAFDGQDLYVLTGTAWASHPSPDSPEHGFTYSISCPTSAFCLAVDWTGAYVTDNGGSWSAAKTISSTSGMVDSVSCVSATFCMAVSGTGSEGGHIYTYNGSSWSDLGPFGYNLSSVSCTSRQFCEVMAYLDGSVYALTWNGKAMSWPPVLVDSGADVSPQPTIGYVSCASATFCAAVDAGGNALTFNGKTWSSPDTIDAGTTPPLDAVSCPTTTFCTAIDGWGQAFTYNGSTWSGPAGLESSGDLQSISCTAGHFCAVVDLSGNVLTYDGASWSGPTYIDPDVSTGYGFTGVSCPDAASCVAVDWEGNAITGSG